MFYFNNRYISPYRILFVLVDTTLILGAVAIGTYLRFWIDEFYIVLPYFVARGFVFAFVFQMSLYYFELYDFKIIRDPASFSYCFAQSVATTIIVLTVLYYIFPILTLGRGVLLFTVFLSVSATFLWRLIYRSLVRASQFSERIIILGTGDFAKEIAREIHDKKDSGFEVIGHIDEEKQRRWGKHDAA